MGVEVSTVLILSRAGARAVLPSCYIITCAIIGELHQLHVHRTEQRFNFVGSKT